MLITNETFQSVCQIPAYQILFSFAPFVGSLIIAFTTIILTQCLKDRKSYENDMDLLIYELNELQIRLQNLRKVLNETIENVENKQDQKDIELIDFPDCSLSTINSILSQKHLLANNEWDKISRLKHNSINLSYIQLFYQKYPYIATAPDCKLYNNGKIQLLKAFIKFIDDFNENFNNFTQPKTPSLFKFFWY
jgi:hypothetical protein